MSEELTLNFCEAFTSIQGEGPYAGRPMIFVRLSGCNLNCPWCDTKYHREGTKAPVSALVGIVQAADAKHGGIKDVCITGGEPLMQAEGVTEYIRTLKALGYRVVVETNGTLKPETFASYVVSPKIDNMPSDEMMRLWHGWSGLSQMKFVYDCEDDLDRIDEVCNKFKLFNVYLMPKGITLESQLELSRLASDWVLRKAKGERCYIIMPRLHIMMWGNQRGK